MLETRGKTSQEIEEMFFQDKEYSRETVQHKVLSEDDRTMVNTHSNSKASNY